MNKILFSLSILLVLVLAACSPSTTETPAGSTDTDLPVAAELAVGTLNLAGTEQEVSAAQAEELVVYWQVYQELSQSETAAQAEIDGLVAQIEETMTEDQMQAIGAMEITQQDLVASIQSSGVVSSTAGESTVSLPSGGGDMPAGGLPADGGVPPDGAMPADMGGAAPDSGTDQTTSGAGDTGMSVVPATLVEALIQSLQQKIAA